MNETKLPESSAMPEEPSFPVMCYANRELSWLKFDERCLEEATDRTGNPLCERLSFASIFQSNLDEFFMVRVGSLFDTRKSALRENKTGMTSQEQLDAVLSRVKSLLKEKDSVYQTLSDELRGKGFSVLSFSDLDEKERRHLEKRFTGEIRPLLSPQIIAPKQPFPFLQNKEIYAVVSLRTKESGRLLGIVPCSSRVIDRLIPVSADSRRYILLEDLILHFVPRIFENYRIADRTLIRIVRNADISIDAMLSESKEAKRDYRKNMERMIRRRKRLCPIKMEYTGSAQGAVIADICRYLNIGKKYVFRSEAPLDLSFLFRVQDILRDQRELFFPKRVPQSPAELSPTLPVMEQVRRRDIFLSYPYESIRPFIGLLNEAAIDPNVVSIRMTLYRVAQNSLIVDALCRAAENGKDVLVLVELRARFDEENNIGWSRILEDSGCRIIYGLDDIKIHSKLCLITRKNGDKVEYITQIGTGNYNENTARLYTDCTLITANPAIGEEAAGVFHSLSLGEVVEQTRHLLVAPHCLQNRLCEMIDEQIALAAAGKPAYIGVKTNALTDRVLIDRLISASQAGVKIDLLVRGICCVLPGIEGYTDNITVHSIVGRYLEHSRIYIFGIPQENPKVYISSADFMTRNTIRRVEVAAPIYDPAIRARLLTMFDVQMRDNIKTRVLHPDGYYVRRVLNEQEKPLNSQEYFYEEAYRAAEAQYRRDEDATRAIDEAREAARRANQAMQEVKRSVPLTASARSAAPAQSSAAPKPTPAPKQTAPQSKPAPAPQSKPAQPAKPAAPQPAEKPKASPFSRLLRFFRNF